VRKITDESGGALSDAVAVPWLEVSDAVSVSVVANGAAVVAAVVVDEDFVLDLVAALPQADSARTQTNAPSGSFRDTAQS
jgi:hypothetical protein